MVVKELLLLLLLFASYNCHFGTRSKKNKKHKVKSEKIYKRKTRSNVAKLLANIEFATYSTHMSHRNGGSCREWVTKGLCLPTFAFYFVFLFFTFWSCQKSWPAGWRIEQRIVEMGDVREKYQMQHSCCANRGTLILIVLLGRELFPLLEILWNGFWWFQN